MSENTKRSASNAKVDVQGGYSSFFMDVDPATPVPELFGPREGIARLVGNENPFGPSPKAVSVISQSVARSGYYADRAVFRLMAMIAERHGVEPTQVVLAAGSTEILYAVSLAWGSNGAILCPDLFWDAPMQYAEGKGVKCIPVPMARDMQIDMDGMARLLSDDIAMVHLVNPNNPTGLLLDRDALHAFAAKVGKAGATLVIDEAYNELTDAPDENTGIDLVKAGADVIVTRTFSKIYGMAGLRVGYAISSEENIARIKSYIASFGGNTAGLAGALASYNDQEFLDFSKSAILEGRGRIEEAARQCGLSTLPSQTNFVFVQVPDADAVKLGMEQRGIIIRGAFGEWKQYSRASVGTRDDVDRYVAALPEVIAELD